MLTYIAKRLSSFFIGKNFISEEDREIYDYCFEVMITTVIKWKRIANEEQVSIYRATSKNGTYEKVANVDMKSDGARAYIDNSVKTGVKYYYKVRPRSNYGDGFKYGEYSDIVSCTAS